MWGVGQTGAHSRFGGVSRNKRAVSSFARPTRLFFASPSVSHSDSVGALALPESLVEALAQRDVRLALGALQELLDLPRARTLRLLLLHPPSVRLLLLRIGLLWRRGGGSLRSAAATTTARHGVADDMADGRAHGDASSGGGHLFK